MSGNGRGRDRRSGKDRRSDGSRRKAGETRELFDYASGHPGEDGSGPVSDPRGGSRPRLEVVKDGGA